jgi:hypothetical protein
VNIQTPVSQNLRKRLDPVTLEVIRNAFPAISNEMSYDLQRTSYNMMIYEVCDYSCTLLDTEGTLISQNIGGVSHFIADMGVVIKDGVARYGLDGFAPGDVLITVFLRRETYGVSGRSRALGGCGWPLDRLWCARFDRPLVRGATDQSTENLRSG